jgi:hypothetical protein
MTTAAPRERYPTTMEGIGVGSGPDRALNGEAVDGCLGGHAQSLACATTTRLPAESRGILHDRDATTAAGAIASRSIPSIFSSAEFL